MTNNNEDIIISHPRLVRALEWLEERNPVVRAFVLNTLFFGALGLVAGYLVLMYLLGGWSLLTAMSLFLLGFMLFLKREL